MTCSYVYDLHKDDEDFENDKQYSRKELKSAYNNPIQLHYATKIKPWSHPDCTKSEEWFKVLVKTPFLRKCLHVASETINSSEKIKYKNIFSITIPTSKRKKITIKMFKEKILDI